MLDILLGLINSDPIIRGVVWAFLILGGLFAGVALYIRRYVMAEALAPLGDFLQRLWLLWAPLLKSRTVVSGLVMFGAGALRASLPPEALNALTEVALALVSSGALVGVVIGRKEASGPIRLNREGILSPGAQAELDASHANSRQLSAFMGANSDWALEKFNADQGRASGPWSRASATHTATAPDFPGAVIAIGEDAPAPKPRAKRKPAAKRKATRKRA